MVPSATTTQDSATFLTAPFVANKTRKLIMETIQNAEANIHTAPKECLLAALLERCTMAQDMIERILDPAPLQWDLFDYEGQEAELREGINGCAFALDESDLMDHMTVDQVLEPIELYLPEQFNNSGELRARYHNDAVFLLKALSLARERILSAMASKMQAATCVIL